MVSSIYKTLAAKFPSVKNDEFGELVNFSANLETPLYGWFRYREGYSSALVEKFISKDDVGILDPFCGSGTTLLTAKIKGIPSCGFDINPLSTFVSKVKTEDYPATFMGQILKVLPRVIDVSKTDYTLPSLKLLKRAFNKDILATILKIKTNIFSISDEREREFLLLAWLIILEKVSNTYKEGNGIKYRTTKRTPNGYIQVDQKSWEENRFGIDKEQFVLDTLNNQVRRMLDDLATIEISKTPVTIINQDAQLVSSIPSNSISLTIFSPPYANCFDYFETYKLELWLGGFVTSHVEMRSLRRRALRSNLNTDLSMRVDRIESLERLLNQMDEKALWDKRIPNVLRGYFTDMKNILKSILGVTVKGGKCVVVVGNSAYGNVLVPTDLLLAELGRAVGFKRVNIVVARYLTTSSQQKSYLDKYREFLRESVVIFEK